jgi:hypothetical protein
LTLATAIARARSRGYRVGAAGVPGQLARGEAPDHAPAFVPRITPDELQQMRAEDDQDERARDALGLDSAQAKPAA